MGRRDDREPYLALIEACLTRFFGVDRQYAHEQVERLRRSRLIARIEHVEAFEVAYELAHPDEDPPTRIHRSRDELRRHRPEYEQLMVETGFLLSASTATSERATGASQAAG
jgi:hypothetical protein